MSEFLLFTLYAPLASWGEIAVGEARPSWDRPSRSAVLGLVAAALGITREEQTEHDGLDLGYGFAVRLDAPGSPLVDYHTTQTVSAGVAKRQRNRTRARLLSAGEPGTSLSRRAYRQDALATAALWLRPDAAQRSAASEVRVRPLSELAAALRAPVFALYAGRKSNPFGLPLAPEVIEAPSLAEAFLRRAASRGMQAGTADAARTALDPVWDHLRPREGWGREISHDSTQGIPTGLSAVRREVRRDTAPHRERWHFASRHVEVGVLPELSSAESEP